MRSLWRAADTNNMGMLESLIKAGRDVNKENSLHETPLHLAAARGYTDAVALLLRAGSLVDARTRAFETPLLLAVRRGATAVARELLASGADVDAADWNGETPRAVAEACGDAVLQATVLHADAVAPCPLGTGRSVLRRIEHRYADGVRAALERERRLKAQVTGSQYGPLAACNAPDPRPFDAQRTRLKADLDRLARPVMEWTALDLASFAMRCSADAFDRAVEARRLRGAARAAPDAASEGLIMSVPGEVAAWAAARPPRHGGEPTTTADEEASAPELADAVNARRLGPSDAGAMHGQWSGRVDASRAAATAAPPDDAAASPLDRASPRGAPPDDVDAKAASSESASPHGAAGRGGAGAERGGGSAPSAAPGPTSSPEQADGDPAAPLAVLAASLARASEPLSLLSSLEHTPEAEAAMTADAVTALMTGSNATGRAFALATRHPRPVEAVTWLLARCGLPPEHRRAVSLPLLERCRADGSVAAAAACGLSPVAVVDGAGDASASMSFRFAGEAAVAPGESLTAVRHTLETARAAAAAGAAAASAGGAAGGRPSDAEAAAAPAGGAPGPAPGAARQAVAPASGGGVMVADLTAAIGSASWAGGTAGEAGRAGQAAAAAPRAVVGRKGAEQRAGVRAQLRAVGAGRRGGSIGSSEAALLGVAGTEGSARGSDEAAQARGGRRGSALADAAAPSTFAFVGSTWRQVPFLFEPSSDAMATGFVIMLSGPGADAAAAGVLAQGATDECA